MRRALSTLLVALVACSSGDTNPDINCGPNGDCPSGYTCDSKSNKCVANGSLHADGGALVTFTLAVTGGGTVQVSGQTACRSASCAYQVPGGTQLMLTAVPPTGGNFTAWAGACSGQNPMITITADATTSCTAMFSGKIMVSATVAGASGTVAASSPGGTCSMNACTIDPGDSVTFVAPPIQGFRFSSWSNGCTGTSPTVTLTNIQAEVDCTASYVPGALVTGTVVGATGTVDAESTSPGAMCQNGTCALDPGGSATLTAQLISGYRFTGWSGDRGCSGTNPTLTFTNVTTSVSCNANYLQRITVTALTATVTSTDLTADCHTAGTCIVDAHGKVTLTAPPVQGYRFARWGGDCTGGDNPLVLTDLVANHTCTTTYVKRVAVTGAVTGGPTQMVAVAGDLNATCKDATCTIDAGTGATLTAPMVTGYRLSAWMGPAGCTGSAYVLMLANVSADTTCTANYVPTVTVSGIAAGVTTTIAATSTEAHADCSAGNACVVDAPGTVTLTAMAVVGGIKFWRWVGGGPCTGTNPALVVSNATSDVTCTAVYSVSSIVSVSGTASVKPTLTIASSDPGASCTMTQCTLPAGATIDISATAPPGNRFVGWTGTNCTGLGLNAQTSFTVLGDTTCFANFVETTGTIAPNIMSQWLNPTGWLDAKNNPPVMTFLPTTGGVWECRTGRTAQTAPTASLVGNQPWAPCDGDKGTLPTYTGKPILGDESGSYRTDVRFHIVDYISQVKSYSYYAHTSLNGAEVCTSNIADADIINVAAAAAVALPNNGGTGSLSNQVSFPDSTSVTIPFTSITFTNPQYEGWNVAGILLPGAVTKVDPTPMSPLVINLRTLRHRLLLDSSGHYLLIRRLYESHRRKLFENVDTCQNTFEFGWRSVMYGGKRMAGAFGIRRYDCVGFVLDAMGHGICVIKDPQTGALVPKTYSFGAWEKLRQQDNFSPKGYGTLTCGITECVYLPD
jgi:hypothetical protein